MSHSGIRSRQNRLTIDLWWYVGGGRKFDFHALNILRPRKDDGSRGSSVFSVHATE